MHQQSQSPMPAARRRWKRWKVKCQDDSETKNWLTANTKACPKCGKPVEKNGGCNLVVCMCGQVGPSQQKLVQPYPHIA